MFWKNLSSEKMGYNSPMKRHIFHDVNGERKNQMLVLADRSGTPVGYATREECHAGRGRTHLAFMAFVYDGDGNVVLTKRSKTKSLWSGYWDASVVSHVLPGETVEAAARRRGKEELGIEVDFHSIGSFYYISTFGNNCENEFCFILIGKSTSVIHPNDIEIEEIIKLEVDDFKKNVKVYPKNFTPWLHLALKNVSLPSKL